MHSLKFKQLFFFFLCLGVLQAKQPQGLSVRKPTAFEQVLLGVVIGGGLCVYGYNSYYIQPKIRSLTEIRDATTLIVETIFSSVKKQMPLVGAEGCIFEREDVKEIVKALKSVETIQHTYDNGELSSEPLKVERQIAIESEEM